MEGRESEPPENRNLNVKSIAKNCNFLPKNCQWSFFSEQFFEKKCQVFGNFLTFKRPFSGGSGSERDDSSPDRPQ